MVDARALADAVVAGSVPEGFLGSERSEPVGPAAEFNSVAVAVLGWGIQHESGIRFVGAVPRMAPGARMVAKVRWVPGRIQCTVERVIDEPGRRGFVVVTNPGHTLEGAELFLVEEVDGSTVLTVREVSRAASWLTRLPGARLVQRRILNRYIPAARRLVATGQSGTAAR